MPQSQPIQALVPARGSTLALPTRKAPPAARKRKTHTKSRRGCLNCKLFHVKCDETRPHCKRCLHSTLACEYPDSLTDKSSALSTAPTHRYERTIDLSSRDLEPPSPSVSLVQRLPLTHFEIPLYGGSSYTLTEHDDMFLRGFHSSTCISLAPHGVGPNINRLSYEAGCRSPVVVHAMITLSLLQHHTTSSSQTIPPRLAFHYYHGTAMMRDCLTRPAISAADSEATWTLAVLLSFATWAITDPSMASGGARFGPRNIWPCDRDNYASLGWITMLSGRMALLRRLQNEFPEGAPPSIDSAFKMYMDSTKAGHRIPTRDLVAKLSTVLTRSAIADLLVLANYPPDGAPQEEWDRNPYSVPLTVLAHAVILPPPPTCITEHFYLLRWIHENMREKLLAPDPLVVLLLTLLFVRLATGNVWWLHRRVPIQLESMCLYLEEQGRIKLGISREAMDVLLTYPRRTLSSPCGPCQDSGGIIESLED